MGFIIWLDACVVVKLQY